MLLAGGGTVPPGGPVNGYTCLRCGLTSYSRMDAEQRYCGNCHKFEDDCMEYPTGSHCSHWQLGSRPCCSCQQPVPGLR